jgi:hypothetical protein
MCSVVWGLGWCVIFFVVCVFCFCPSGFGGLSVALLGAALGSLQASIGVDKLLSMAWWSVLLLWQSSASQAALENSGAVDAANDLFVLVIAVYVSSSDTRQYLHCKRPDLEWFRTQRGRVGFQWFDPLGRWPPFVWNGYRLWFSLVSSCCVVEHGQVCCWLWPKTSSVPGSPRWRM